MPDSLSDLRDQLRDFAQARDWEQFHTPKNLAMALAAEVGELLEIFQWLTPEESEGVSGVDDRQDAVADELADITIYLVRLADVLGIDLAAVSRDKIKRNEERFPKATG